MVARREAIARLLLATALALAAAAPTRAEEEDANPGLWSRLHRIEGAFRSGDATALRPAFSSGKVRLDLKDVAEGQGSFAPGQLQVIFTQIFESTRTREFDFAQADVKVSGPGTAFARGRWVRRRPPAGESEDGLTFTLRQEGNDWRILEIRSSR